MLTLLLLLTSLSDAAPIKGELTCATEAGTAWPHTTIRLQARPTVGGWEVRWEEGPLHTDSPTVTGSWRAAQGDADRQSVDWTFTGGWITLDRHPDASGLLAGAVALGGTAHELVCWDEGVRPRYTYDASVGECLNRHGQPGLADWPIILVRETGYGECGRFAGISLEEGDLSYPVLSWNLAGADLTGASTHFAILEDIDFAGADLRGWSMGYVTVTGTIDQYTQGVPSNIISGNTIYFNY